MSAALVPSPATESRWTIMSGAMKGAVKVLHDPAFTIGRSPESQFVIVNDPKCSRRHATVQWTSRGCEITSQSRENPVAVNGAEVSTAVLKNDDVVTLG